jgi:hypothetical protein
MRKSKITKSTQEDHVSTILSPPTGSVDEKQYILIRGLELPYSSLAQQSIISKISISFNLSRKPYHLQHSCNTQGKYMFPITKITAICSFMYKSN